MPHEKEKNFFWWEEKPDLCGKFLRLKQSAAVGLLCKCECNPNQFPTIPELQMLFSLFGDQDILMNDAKKAYAQYTVSF